MKNKILEKFTQSRTLFVDLDGVLVNWLKGYIDSASHDFPGDLEEYEGNDQVEKFENYLIKEFGNGEGKKKFWSYATGHDWWANLEWISGGKELWSYVKPHNPTILTAPSQDPGCYSGKKEWVSKNLGKEFAKTMIINKQKWKWSGRNKILIDDMYYNIEPWEEKGGIGVLHNWSHYDETIQKLSELGF